MRVFFDFYYLVVLFGSLCLTIAKFGIFLRKLFGKIGEAIKDPLLLSNQQYYLKMPLLFILTLTKWLKKLGVAIHLSKGKHGYVIHNIASVYSRSQSQKDIFLTENLKNLFVFYGIRIFAFVVMRLPSVSVIDIYTALAPVGISAERCPFLFFTSTLSHLNLCHSGILLVVV